MPFYNNFNGIYGFVVFFVLLAFLFTLIPFIRDVNWNNEIKNEDNDAVRQKIPLYIIPNEEGDNSFYTLHPDNWSRIFSDVSSKPDEIHEFEERELVVQGICMAFFGVMLITCLVHCIMICTLPNDRRCSEVLNTIIFALGIIIFIIGPILAFVSLASINSNYSKVTEVVMKTVREVAAAENKTIQGSIRHICDYNENGDYLTEERRDYHTHYYHCGHHTVCAHDEVYYYRVYRQEYIPKYGESRNKAYKIGICQTAWSKELGIFFAIVSILMFCWVLYAMKYEYEMANTQAITVQPVGTKSQVQVYYQAYPGQGYAYPSNQRMQSYYY